MQKNTASKWTVFAFGAPDHATLAGLPITGDAAQITANVRIDGGAADAVDDTNPAELEDGYYIFDITAVENNGDLITIAPESSTLNVIVIGTPGSIYTTPANFNALDIESGGIILADSASHGGNSCEIMTDITSNAGGFDLALLSITNDLTVGNDLTVTGTTDFGTLDAGTLAQVATPTNITAGTITNLTNKTGFSLAATGLDLVLVTSTFMFALIKGVWDRIISKTNHNIAQSAGKSLRQATSGTLNDGELQSATASTATLAAGASTEDNFYRHALIISEGQHRIISAYDGATKVASVTPDWTVTPAGTPDYAILPASVHAATMNGGYNDGFVYFDSMDGVNGTTPYVNGTITRPVKTIEQAKVVLDLLGLKKIFLYPGTTDMLSEDLDNILFLGPGSNLDLNGFSVSGSRFASMAIQGVGTGASRTVFTSVKFIGPTSLEAPAFIACDIANDITITGANNVNFRACTNSSNTSVSVDVGAASGSVHLNFTVNGSFEIENMGQDGTDTMTYLGIGDLIFNVNCIGGVVNAYGHPNITNNGAVTVNDKTAIKLLDDIQGATFSTSTDSLEAIRARGDAEWTTGGGGAAPTVEDIADAVWDEAKAGHTAADTYGKLVQDTETDVNTLLGRITSALFSGITSMKQWLGIMCGIQTGNATARTEIRSSGSGSGTYDEATDSLEGLAGAGVGGAPTAIQNRIEMDDNSTQLALITSRFAFQQLAELPLPDNTILTVIRGDAYDDTAHSSISLTTTQSIAGTTGNFTVRGPDGEILIDQDTTGVTVTTSGTTFNVALTSAATNLLTVGTHKYDFEVVFAADSKWTVANSLFKVVEDQSRV